LIEAGLFGLKYAAYEGDETKLSEKTSFLTNVQDTFVDLAQTLAIDFRVNKQSRDWHALTKAIKVRNRITHPKKVEDLDIRDKELEYLHRSAKFFAETTHKILSRASH